MTDFHTIRLPAGVFTSGRFVGEAHDRLRTALLAYYAEVARLEAENIDHNVRRLKAQAAAAECLVDVLSFGTVLMLHDGSPQAVAIRASHTWAFDGLTFTAILDLVASMNFARAELTDPAPLQHAA